MGWCTLQNEEFRCSLLYEGIKILVVGVSPWVMEHLSRRRWATIPAISVSYSVCEVIGFLVNLCVHHFLSWFTTRGRYSCSSPSTKVLHGWVRLAFERSFKSLPTLQLLSIKPSYPTWCVLTHPCPFRPPPLLYRTRVCSSKRGRNKVGTYFILKHQLLRGRAWVLKGCLSPASD